MNRINKVFQKDGTIMYIYFTAGFPAKNAQIPVLNKKPYNESVKVL